MRHPWKAWWQTCHLGYFRGNIVDVNIPSHIMRKHITPKVVKFLVISMMEKLKKMPP